MSFIPIGEGDVELDSYSSAIYNIVVPVISTLGLIGNFLSIVVLMRRRFLQQASYVYLRSIAWADTGYLIFTLQVSNVHTTEF